MKLWLIWDALCSVPAPEDFSVVAWCRAETEQEARIMAVSAGYYGKHHDRGVLVQCLDDLPEVV